MRTTQRVPVGFSDQLADGGLPPGTRGVVVRSAPGFLSADLMVEYDAGLGGTVTARTPARHLRMVRRNGGIDSFQRRTGRLAAARAGVAAVFIAPIGWFMLMYIVHNHTTHGMLTVLTLGLVYGALDFVNDLIEAPAHAIVYLLVSTVAWKFAFGR